MTWLLIAANVAAFGYELMLPAEVREAIFYQFGMVPARYTDPGWAVSLGLAPIGLLPFLTSMFLHSALLHIVSNMWTLWIFGDNVEDRMGPFRVPSGAGSPRCRRRSTSEAWRGGRTSAASSEACCCSRCSGTSVCRHLVPAEGRHYVYGHPSERHHYRF